MRTAGNIFNVHHKFSHYVLSLMLFILCAQIPLTAQSKSDIANGLRAQKDGKYAQDFVPSKEEHPFALDPVGDTVITLGGAALLGADYLIEKRNKKKNNAPIFIGSPYDPESITGIDSVFMNPYSKNLDIAGDVLQIATMLTPAIVMLKAPKSDFLTIGMMYLESMLWAYSAKEFGKNIANRIRPYMYYSGYPQSEVDSGDWHKSFPSGHTTLAFNAAAFTSYTFGTYFPDSKLKIPVIAASYSLAAATAYMRMRSGNHFFTDVLTGAVIGTNTGLLVPILHTYFAQLNKSGRGLTARLLPNGLILKYAY